MKNTHLSILFVAFTFMNCGPNGPSQEEIIAKKKHITDSLEIVKLDSIKAIELKLELERIHLQKIEVGQSILERRLTNIIENLKATLRSQQLELNQINEFQLGRLKSTKQRELRNQHNKIYNVESKIRKIDKEISMSKLFNSFDFQETPAGTIEHLFYAAKNNDYQKMRHLLDPYGEYDNDALYLCHVEMLSDSEKQEWEDLFGKGRIMSDPVINEKTAEIEIAIGFHSNKLEKINLVERMGRWYIAAM